MGFAIPSNDVVNIINQLEKDGKGDKASGKAKEAVENVKEKANDVIDKFKGNKGD